MSKLEVDFDIASLTEVVRKLGRTAGTDIFGVQASAQNHLVASLNLLLTNNDLDGFAAQWINQGIFDALSGINRDEARATRETTVTDASIIAPQI